jgi:hypothetical protein
MADAPRTCATATVGTLDQVGYQPGQVIVYNGPGGDAGDGNALTVQFEFYSGIETSLMGTFDLTQGNQNNYKTCAVCVRAYSLDSSGMPIKQFFQSGGSVTLTEDPLTNGHMIASFTNLQLQEVDIAQDYTSTPVANGLCASYGSPMLDHDKAPNAWTCTQAGYLDGTTCDCVCGVSDPDCDARTATTNGCTSGQVCSADACVTAAANDMCSGAQTITVGAAAVNGTTIGAYNDYDAGLEGMSCTGFGQPGQDVAYKVTLTANTQYTVTLSGLAADKDMAVALVGPGTDDSVCTANPITTCVAGADAGLAGADETFTYTPTATGTYYIIVDAYNGNQAGAFTLQVQ